MCAYTETELVHEALVGATHHFIAVELGVGLQLVAFDASPIGAVVGSLEGKTQVFACGRARERTGPAS